MPHKINFYVIHASGSDTGVSLHDLEVHSPLARGWRSPRFCLYPQEIVIQLADKTRIRKLQLLVHQYLIPTKIEFYIGSLPPDHVTTLHGTRYKRLGYVAMSDNSKTGYKARELKSVHVDAVGQYVRLVIHKNHVNKYNVYNQVSLIAINVIGDEITSEEDLQLLEKDNMLKVNQVIKEFMPEGYFSEESNHANKETDAAVFGAINRKDYISPMDDLAFDMYQDPEVAQVIRKLDVRKNEAVLQEQYDLAKKLKQAIADLQKVGEKLGRYEVEKRRAIETEDYDLAKIKKIQMEEYRLQIYQQLEVNDLLKLSKTGEKNNAVVPPENESPRNRLAHVRTSSPSTTGETAANISIPTTVDDRPLPTLKHSPRNDGTEPSHRQSDQDDAAERGEAVNDSVVAGGVQSEHVEPMSENTLRQAAAAIEIFGQELVSKLFSKNWTFREEALGEVKQKLENEVETIDKDELRNMLRASVFLSSKGLKDKVFAVFMSALSLVRSLYEDWIPKHKLNKADTSHSLEVVVPELMTRIGDTNARLKAADIDFIRELASYKEVRPLHSVPHHFVAPFKGTTQAKIAVTRVEIVEKLLKDLGIEKNSGLTVDSVMAFAKRALEHTAGEVREAAVHLIIELYHLKAAAVRSHLPPEDDPKTMKNPLYCKIFDGMDRADGKPTKAERKAKAQSEKALQRKQKQAEIEELQQQLSDLRAAAIAQGKNSEDTDGPSEGKKTKAANKDQLPKKMPRAPSIAEQSDFGDDIDKQCIFCGEEDKSFKDEGLDMHYWKYCPVLKRCHSCKQVVEISAFNNHLLTECEGRAKYAKCPRCTETHEKTEVERYVKDKICQPPKLGMSKCPLCHVSVTAADDKDGNWRKHLMGTGKDACLKNPRRELAIKRVREKSQAADKHKQTPRKQAESTAKSRIPTKDKKAKSKAHRP
ncbi:centrosomal protein of 104 kDa-like isoform X2 [Acanthaster planci]|uniref:Centrosomal protein of 104 kDa n=1 Tax=Acanthaster planci TaxID=133434 RepID=A0A8B7Z9V8_ACAPL|nr:centrosomal protein of 104 kDa-like isoform X2 [Acanthaster planci]